VIAASPGVLQTQTVEFHVRASCLFEERKLITLALGTGNIIRAHAERLAMVAAGAGVFLT
jgi:hypothetical protein